MLNRVDDVLGGGEILVGLARMISAEVIPCRSLSDVANQVVRQEIKLLVARA